MGEHVNVFISSTSSDLLRYRAKVKDAVLPCYYVVLFTLEITHGEIRFATGSF